MAVESSAGMPSANAADAKLLREFHFSREDFERVRKLIYQNVGISLNESKQEMVYSRLARRLRARNLRTFKEYLVLLENGDHAEWEAFTNSLTTNLTSFFREAHHFDILIEHVKKLKHQSPIVLWCAASSTGEEPYSMAMAMVDAFDSYTPPVRILATDVDTNVLATAQQGTYSLDKLEKIPPEKVKRFFLKGNGHHAGSARVRDELRNLITFRRINLLDASWPVRGPLDAIFCRNVMIYFDRPTQHSILKKFAPLLRRDGLLFAGHSENFYHAADLFRLRGKTVYELADKTKACHDARI